MDGTLSTRSEESNPPISLLRLNVFFFKFTKKLFYVIIKARIMTYFYIYHALVKILSTWYYLCIILSSV